VRGGRRAGNLLQEEVRLHVLHVCRSGWPAIGGLESAVQGLARALVRRGHRATVVTLARGPTGERLPDGRCEGVTYRRVPRLGHARYPFARGLIGALRGADIVHVHGIDGLADQIALGGPGVPVGLSTHGGYFHTPHADVLKRVWWRAVTCRTLRRLDAVWFSSRADAERFGALGGRVVENGVDADRYAGRGRAPSRDRWVVLGRVVPHKGLGDLLRAMARQRDPVPVLDVIGPATTAARAAVARAARGLPTEVRVWGARSAAFVRDRLAGAAWAVFPSRYEGFGMAALEVMGAGVPALVADIPALREAVRDGGGCALDFRAPGRAAVVLDGIRATSDDPRRSAEAVRVARAADWDVRVEGFLDAYRAVLGEWS